MSKQKNKLKSRIEICRKKLTELEIKNQRHDFCLKFPKYKPKDKNDRIAIDRLDNLFYGRVTDETFTSELEAFVIFKENQYK